MSKKNKFKKLKKKNCLVDQDNIPAPIHTCICLMRLGILKKHHS